MLIEATLLARDAIDCLLVPFFFFQAEDGIRDLIVTGVQTCALPISRRFRKLKPLAQSHLRLQSEAEDTARVAGHRKSASRARDLCPALPATRSLIREIGRASCRERV